MKGLGCTQSLMQVRDEATRQACSCDSELWCNVMKHRPGPGTAATLFHHESRYWAGTVLKRVIVRSEPGQQRVRPLSWNCDFKTSYELNYRLQTIFIRIGWISVCLLCHDICNSVTIFTNEILIICKPFRLFIICCWWQSPILNPDTHPYRPIFFEVDFKSWRSNQFWLEKRTSLHWSSGF